MATGSGQDGIRIKVGRHMIDDPNKGEIPIPEFLYGEPFVVQVKWVEPADGLMLTLSDFGLVSSEIEPDPEGQTWIPDPELAVVLQNEEGELLREISFSFSEAKPDEGGELITRKTLILEKSGTRTIRPRHLLVLFKQTLSQVLFEIDPPWAGKPPTG